jgi:hypothetical protein
MISPNVQSILNEIANRYGNELLSQVKAVLAKYRRSGQLSESVELTIIKATDSESPKILVTYADQGYFIGQRSPHWSKVPSIDKLREWAKHVDLKGPVAGYKNGLAPNLPPWKIKERAIWAIAKSKQKFDRHKPKRWKRETKLSDLLENINKNTLDAFSSEIERVLTNALEGKRTS